MSTKLPMRWLAMLLAVVMCVGLLQPVAVFAAETTEPTEAATEPTATEAATEPTTEPTENTDDAAAMPAVVSDEEEDDEEAGVADYQSFMTNLKVLEGYADAYAATSNKDASELVINFIRTGVDRYNDGNWKTLAGEEITGFTTYVEEQDGANGTTAMLLRNIIIDNFTLPNGNQVDFGHMFGTLNIAYVAATATADLGGWAGDICDLMFYSKEYGNVPAGTVEEMASYIKEKCFGVNADDAFGMDDFYGDMDAYYLNNMVKAGTKLSAAMEAYFTASLSDSDRAAYFLNNRFKGLETQEDVRTAIYEAYTSNVGLQVLEADRGLTDDADLRTASCYAFADYLFDLAGDRLEGSDEDEEPEVDLSFTVFSTTNSILAPGITQSVNYALNESNGQFVYYLATIDINRDDVSVQANYKDYDPSAGWGMQRVTEQMAAAQSAHSDVENYTSVVGINADFYNMSNGRPSGALVMEGVTYNGAGSENFFAILKDGTPIIGKNSEWNTYKDQVQEAVGGSIIILKDGEIVAASGSYYTTAGPRSVVGITADGKIVMLVVDGRQSPFSVGATVEETAQILLEAGCVDALHLDGGGSATYAAKPEGSDTVKVISRPSDGYERSVSSSLVAVSTAKSSKEFDHANISSEYDYLTIGTELQMTASGVSNTGNAADLPESAVWQVSDETVGSITAEGVFTASANGSVEVQLTADGAVVGSKMLYVVVPDAMAFEKENINAIYGVPTELPLQMSYKGNAVAFNRDDIITGLVDENAGEIDHLTFVGNEESGVRTVMAAAFLLVNEDIYSVIDISLYKDGEAFFDFDDVTAGNRTLAWNRDVSNSTSTDEVVYHINDVNETMDITYVFGLDMETIEIPEQLADLTYMLPGADAGATAWDFLLQLAERVSVLTEVRVTAQFDADLDIDYSELKVVNDYFYLKSAQLDESTNTLTIICGWVDQTMAIDPATANPICILSGIKATPKDDAAWDAKNQLAITNLGDVSYKIYLRANALYNFANSTANQQKYSLYPFENPDVIVDGNTEKGAYFGSSYATFEDSFILDKTNRQGWYEVDKKLYYYVDNTLVTGTQKLPSYEDASVEMFYEFDEKGLCTGTVTGLIDYEGAKYYAIQGQILTGWRAIFNAEGESVYYYFAPATAKAVDGVQKIGGITYTFEDNILVKGQIVSGRYYWAGSVLIGTWFELDGNEYYATYPTGDLATGFMWVKDHDGQNGKKHLFDENGVWQKDYNGMYHVGEDTYLLENGILIEEPGLVYIDGYYYYFASNGKAVKNRTYWPSKTNGLLPMASYKFDEQGRMINPPTTTPDTPEEPVKNGVVEVNGNLYYYINDALQYGAGLVQLEDGSYIYVRSNGQLAIGQYWITNTNGLLDQGMQTFGEDGKMIVETEDPDDDETDTPTDPSEPSEPDTPTEPEPVKNGVVEVNGALYYYVDGKIDYCGGVIQLADGSYIYVRSNGQLAVGSYWTTNTNGLMPQGMHKFDESGIMLDPPATEEPDDGSDTPTQPEEPEVLNGIVDVNGTLYYYENGSIAYCAGLVKLTDDDGVDFYIYVRSNGQLATGVYWPTNHNDLLPCKGYDFGTDGRLYL